MRQSYTFQERISNKKLMDVNKGVIFQYLTSSIPKETETNTYIHNTTFET